MLLEVGRYANVLGHVQDAVLAPPSGIVEPWLSSSEVGGCRQCARIWRRSGHGFCAVVVVVNTLEKPAAASFDLHGAELWQHSMQALLRRIDGDGKAQFMNGRLNVTLDALDTHVYVT